MAKTATRKGEYKIMYLVEGRNPKDTKGQYVLTKESAYAIFEEMKQDFPKVNIYEKIEEEYKHIEKWEHAQTNYDWLNSLPIEEQAEEMSNLAFKIATYYNGWRKPDNSLYTKEHWLNWLKEVHKE